jgi:hypothetical protein
MRTTALILFSCLLAVAAAGQMEPPNAPHRPDDGGPPRVYFAHSYYSDHWNMAGLDDRISLHVQNFGALLKDANGDCSALVLFMNGLPLKGLHPESCDPVQGHVRYLLRRTADADDAWHKLLGSPHHYARAVSLSIGSTPQFSTRSDVTQFLLEIIPREQFFLFVGIASLGLLLFVVLCRRTSLIRSGSAGVPATERPYSLSLFQMAFWFFLVVVAYVFMWLINDELDTITDSVLGLIGIGAATAIGASMIDRNKGVAANGDTSRGFFRDVLSDAEGLSLYRFQMFVWTLVLGLIFCASVYRNLSMPEFSAALLGLMGISSGTYLGFKVPEKPTTDAPAPPVSS